ncbi:3-deoxy-D-manno-octulosonic acid transferase [Puniceibacterium sp. IMCC21224]|uniref:3-deoxy-D-manno-octulosonic acid transferase n=1 Tax=Puniceibacterium sp. IMCC21224 TaxID=1618204 RepID=UPI00065D8EFA|nr:glycosyltransferase N-terminal domain-containing protein [Puniceibacterium sp. IMCC21224]KMK68691.1 3-deoxy-D-manno-octulosonic-acid transferase [Puniceibacterium sp. IMCC21224]
MPEIPFNLRTYLTFQRGKARLAPDPGWPSRPAGPLLWAHAGTERQQRALATLCTRICHQRPQLGLLMTHPGVAAENTRICTAHLPPETQADTELFARHWSPDLCLWADHGLHPALTYFTSAHGCYQALIDAADAPWTTPAQRWLPDSAPATLARFDTIFTTDQAAERRLRRLGIPETRFERAGPLIESTMTLDCSHRQHAEMAAILSGRPVWLAAHMRPTEIAILLTAHQRASRLNHRLLLFLCPANPQEYEAIDLQLRNSGMRLCHWEDGETLDENTQLVLAGGPEELGLWFRLSPLALLGSSLVSGYGGTNPLDAAALGSAILYGPNVGRHLSTYSRLAEAGAARIVKDVDTLTAAVSQLIAPDRAAAMAHAGWDIVSAGAAMADKVVDLALDVLDRAGAH